MIKLTAAQDLLLHGILDDAADEAGRLNDDERLMDICMLIATIEGYKDGPGEPEFKMALIDHGAMPEARSMQ